MATPFQKEKSNLVKEVRETKSGESAGVFMPTIKWRFYTDYKMAPMCRSLTPVEGATSVPHHDPYHEAMNGGKHAGWAKQYLDKPENQQTGKPAEKRD